MPDLLSFFLVLLAALFFSNIFNRLHLPWVVALLIAGIAIGPFGFDLISMGGTLDFISEIGLVFLMFMAGLETRFSSMKSFGKGIVGIALINSVIPFLVALAIGLLFEYSITASLFLGVIFMSSSIAVVIPSLERANFTRTQIGQSIIASTIIEDVMSLILLSVLLQTISPTTNFPLPLFYLILFVSLVIIRFLIIQIEKIFTSGADVFENQIRLTFVILLGTVIIFELLGLHAIIAGFFAGFVLSGSLRAMRGEALKEKLHAVSYGLFIPTFFVVIGAKTDIGVFTKSGGALSLVILIIVGSISAKLISGYLAGKLSKFSNNESLLIGAASIPQLSTTLAVAFSGFELGILDQKLVSSMVFLSIVTTFLAPILIQIISKRTKRTSRHLSI